MKAWSLQEAKARLSELVKYVSVDGPQAITVEGRSVAVLMSRAEYERLRERKTSFVEFIRRSPLVGARLEIRRSHSTTRNAGR
ncbi:MAG: type II toxin-antitoxin system Phd/YefM family antitoxin [Betaproteobacteria bacterium]|nr:type II toxin-antitoxin system Phd/YefM family antitoxin [Betaproteobacteria bacterium]